MKVAILKTIHHDRLGTLRRKQVVEMDDRSAERYLRAGAVQRYETKVIHESPLPVAGAAEPLSALPAGPASTEPMSQPSKPGAKRRPKKRAVSS